MERNAESVHDIAPRLAFEYHGDIFAGDLAERKAYVRIVMAALRDTRERLSIAQARQDAAGAHRALMHAGSLDLGTTFESARALLVLAAGIFRPGGTSRQEDFDQALASVDALLRTWPAHVAEWITAGR